MTIPRDGVRERGILGILVFGAPRRCDLFGRLCVKCARMPFLFGVTPQKSIFVVRSLFVHCLRYSTQMKAFPTFF